MKYEAVFGNQELFDGAGTFTGLDVVVHSIASGIKSYARLSDLTPESLRNHPVCAMRRIIADPKRWTVEDKKAGRLPDVGAKVDGGKVVFVNGFNVVTELKSGAVIVSSPKTFLNTFNPIETPAEKAQRLEDEWVNKAWSETAVFAGVTQDEHDRLRIHLGHIYRAQLSGELAAPKGGE